MPEELPPLAAAPGAVGEGARRQNKGAALEPNAATPSPQPSPARGEGETPLNAEEARLLTEVGMLAAGAGDLRRARVIFEALRRLRPERAYPLVGLAVAHMNAGRAADAARLLENAKLADPEERAQVRVWRALALQLAGHGEASRQGLRDAARMPGAGARLARRLLGLNETD